MQRPKFKDLIPEQQVHFGNGLGPYWLSDRMRRFITYNMSWFFDDASWRHHDFGYSVGGDRWDRARCDWKFLRAMWRDALSQNHLWMIPVALLLALTFYLAVRIGGQFGSFNYSPRYASLDEIMAPHGPYWAAMAVMEPPWYQANVIGGTVQIYDSWDESEWLLWDDNRPEGEQRLLRTGTPDLSQAIKRANVWLEENGLIFLGPAGLS
jgi:hypothetical protein